MTRCYQRFLDALCSLSLGEAFGEIACNVFVFVAAGLARGVVDGVAVALPVEILAFHLLGCLGLVRTGWLGPDCGVFYVIASAAWPSAVMVAITSSSCLAC